MILGNGVSNVSSFRRERILLQSPAAEKARSASIGPTDVGGMDSKYEYTHFKVRPRTRFTSHFENIHLAFNRNQH